MEMDWSDTGTDFTSFGSYDPSAYDMASFDPAPIAAPVYNTPTPDILASQGQYYGNQSDLATGFVPNPQSPFLANQYSNPAASINSADPYSLQGLLGLSPGGPGTPTGSSIPGGTGTGGVPGAGSGGGGLFGAGGGLGTPSLLGLLGGGAGLIGSLLAGGKTGSSMPIMSTPMRAAGNQSYDALQGLTQFAQGQSPLQQQQTALLDALARGQATPGLQQLIQQAYGPAWQSVAQQSIEAGRNAGFTDNPMSSPVGGAVMGPAAAQLQGQEANSLLNAMYQVPGMFQAPINAQIGAQGSQATGFSNLMGQYPYGTQQSVPLASQVGQGAAGTLLGLGQGMQQNANQVAQQSWQNQMLQQQQQSNNDFRKMMAQSVMNQGPVQTGLSGQTQQQPGGYDFSATYGGPSGGNG
jgi:hypothetical protein